MNKNMTTTTLDWGRIRGTLKRIRHSDFRNIQVDVCLNAIGLPTLDVHTLGVDGNETYSQGTIYYPWNDTIGFDAPDRLTYEERQYVLNAYRGLRVIVKYVRVQESPTAWAIESAWYGDWTYAQGDILPHPMYSIEIEAVNMLEAIDGKRVIRKKGIRSLYCEPRRYDGVKCKIKAWGYYGAKA